MIIFPRSRGSGPKSRRGRLRPKFDSAFCSNEQFSIHHLRCSKNPVSTRSAPRPGSQVRQDAKRGRRTRRSSRPALNASLRTCCNPDRSSPGDIEACGQSGTLYCCSGSLACSCFGSPSGDSQDCCSTSRRDSRGSSKEPVRPWPQRIHAPPKDSSLQSTSMCMIGVHGPRINTHPGMFCR